MTLLSAQAIVAMHDTLATVANATLIAIERPGTLARNGDPGEPVAVWTGAARGFLDGATSSEVDGDIEVDSQTDSLLVYDASGADVALLVAGADWTAATIVVTDERLSAPAVRRYTVVGLERDADGTLDSITLTLNAARPVT